MLPKYNKVNTNKLIYIITVTINTWIKFNHLFIGEYANLAEMEKDLLQMCRNAWTFNEPGSQIYKDAKTLKKVVTSKKYEIEHGRVSISTPGKSERIRNRRLRSGVSQSAITAALQYEDDDDEEEEEEEGEEAEGDSDEGSLVITYKGFFLFIPIISFKINFLY